MLATQRSHSFRTRIGLNNSHNDEKTLGAALWASSDDSYSDNKIRFPAPVPVDSRVRGKAEVVSVEEVGGGWWQVVTRFTLEVEGSEKPCFVGDSVPRVMAPSD